MGRIHFLEHYKYKQFVDAISQAGAFPSCPKHQLSRDNLLNYLDSLWKNQARFEQIIDSWEAVSYFITFHFQQPIQVQIEMYTPYDFSRFICHFVPIFKPEAKTDVEVAANIFDCLVNFLSFLFDQKIIETLEPILIARHKVIRSNRISPISRRRLFGPEWAVIQTSPVDSTRKVFTFTDIWLLAVFQKRFGSNTQNLHDAFCDPELAVRNRLQKQAHFARLKKRLRKHHFRAEKLLRPILNQKLIHKAQQWFVSGRYIDRLEN
jgi:hypothetical protein